ncbi:MAG: M42 family peptidase, partial [Nitrospinota bacterium]
GRGYFINPRMKELLEGVAQRNGIALQRAASLGFYTTDAARVYLSGAGVPTAVLAVPRRYSHTPVEVLDLRDALGALRLVLAFVRELGPDEAFDFLTATR